MKQQAARGAGVPIASRRSETETKGTLAVSSSAFRDGTAIPATYSEYDQGASFPLSWTAGPAGTRGYELIMEDPDSKRPPVPVIHSLAWNIPAGVRLGPCPAGSYGLRCPRPPVGDPPHHYHVLLVAVDRKLFVPVGADRD